MIYKNGVKANLGNELTPTQVKDKPSIKWAGKENKYYTLVLTGKSREIYKNCNILGIFLFLNNNNNFILLCILDIFQYDVNILDFERSGEYFNFIMMCFKKKNFSA